MRDGAGCGDHLGPLETVQAAGGKLMGGGGGGVGETAELEGVGWGVGGGVVAPVF